MLGTGQGYPCSCIIYSWSCTADSWSTTLTFQDASSPLLKKKNSKSLNLSCLNTHTALEHPCFSLPSWWLSNSQHIHAIKNQVSWRHGLHWQASFKLCSTCTDSSTSCCCLLQATCYRVIKVTKAKPVTRINLPFTDKQARRKEVVRNAGWVSGPHSLSSTHGVIAVNACARGDSWFWLSYAFKTDSTV